MTTTSTETEESIFKNQQRDLGCNCIDKRQKQYMPKYVALDFLVKSQSLMPLLYVIHKYEINVPTIQCNRK